MSQSQSVVYQFGPFRYDPAQRLLFRDRELIPLVPKVADTLRALFDRRGQVVDKTELLRLVWPDCVVEDVGLARNISLLRKALGDDAGTYIETIPKRGYRFAAEVSEVPADQPAESSLDRPPSASLQRQLRLALIVLAIFGFAMGGVIYWQFYRPSRFVPQQGSFVTLAVVPFDCLTADLEREAFCQGFTVNLVAEISKLKGVQVISPSTVSRYRRLQIPTALMARSLGLQVVAEGAAQRLNRRIRLTVRLTDVHSGRLIWAEGYNLAPEDLDHSEAEVARTIAVEIGRRLSL